MSAWAIDPPPEYTGRRDPNNEGGERLGAHEDPDGDDDFTGYPADPGDPSDNYYDPGAEYRRYSPNYTGQTLGFGVLVGGSMNYGRAFEAKTFGPTFGGLIEATSLLGAASFYGSIRRTQYGGAQLANDGPEVDIVMHEVVASAALHPLLFFILGASWWDVVATNIYTMAGGSLVFFDAEGGGVDSNFIRPAWHLGAGFDIPLDNYNDGGAFWIGLQWRWNNTAGGRKDDLFRDTWIRDQQLLVRFMYRWNGLIGSGIQGPRSP